MGGDRVMTQLVAVAGFRARASNRDRAVGHKSLTTMTSIDAATHTRIR
jgi:hypothetical protein